jgi:hypothetical protein
VPADPPTAGPATDGRAMPPGATDEGSGAAAVAATRNSAAAIGDRHTFAVQTKRTTTEPA